MTLPIIAEKGRMTEAEARMVGCSATRIAQLRDLSKQPSTGGSLTMKTGSIVLTALDTAACLALLIEREASFLLGFNIELEAPITGG